MSDLIINPDDTPGMPVLLVDSVDLDLTQVNGQVKPLSSQKMSNIYDCAIAIDEIRFYVLPRPLTVFSGAFKLGNIFDLSAPVNVRMRTGNINLMSNPVHLRSLGTRWQDQLSVGSQSQNISTLPNRKVTFTSAFWRWVLPAPIYMNRGGSLDVQIGLDPQALWPFAIPDTIATGLRVYVAARGRMLPQVQQSMQAYPYVAEASALLQNSNVTQPKFAMFNNPTFLNPFYQPLRLQRIVASLYSDTNIGNGVQVIRDDILSMVPDAVMARMWGSRGDNIAGYGGGNPIPLGGLVDPRTGDWQIEKNIDAQQWVNLELYTNSTAFSTDAILAPRVALIGTQMAQFVP